LIRRLKLDERTNPLVRRDRSVLPFFEQTTYLPKLLLDTTVYIDQFQLKLSPNMEQTLKNATVWHSSVTASELSILAGLLDPRHTGTAKAMEEILALLDIRPNARTITPDAATWAEAGVLAGLITRLQQHGPADRRRTLNDALIYLSAARAGLTVLTRNVADFDLLQQLHPQGTVLFYEI
jgi:predicted nucleic acid-binding protein